MMCDFDFIKLFNDKLQEKKPNWYVKGLIDSDKNILTLGTDSKLIGRIFELKSNKILQEIADENKGYTLHKPEVQTDYPDYYYLCPDGKRIAVDIKTTYLDKNNPDKKKRKKVIKYTLGSYTSYLRDGKKNISGKYEDYKAHYVVGFVYDRESNSDGEIYPYTEENLQSISCPYGNVRVWVQEKYKIVGTTEGSGNTANIGSISKEELDDFINGTGPFSAIDEIICEDYWRYYTKGGPYKNVEQYFEWAKTNSTVKIDFEEQERKYNEWRRNTNPTKEDLLFMASEVIRVRGRKNCEKGLIVKVSDREEIISLKKTEINKYISYCEKNKIAIIDVEEKKLISH